MEAKEIVAQEVARQADFGYEPSWEDFVIAGQQAGIREVAEWIRRHTYWRENATGLIKLPTINLEEWRAKLKEWVGVKDNGNSKD